MTPEGVEIQTKKACGGSPKKLFRGATVEPARPNVPARSVAVDRIELKRDVKEWTRPSFIQSSLKVGIAVF
jgi:hypothetical protein